MIPQNETFNGSWNYEPKFCTESGFRQHYVDEGEGEVVVCLHGEPTWGYLYRNMIDPLAEEFRVVVVPDIFLLFSTPEFWIGIIISALLVVGIVYTRSTNNDYTVE